MKDKRKNYTQLKMKLLRQMALLSLAAVALTMGLREMVRGRLGEGIVRLLTSWFYLDYEDAHTIYQFTIRNNLPFLIMLGMILLLLVGYQLIIRAITHYFDELGAGMDALMEHPEEKITLSPEMAFMEEKLNEYQFQLMKKEKDARMEEQRKNDLVVYLAHDIRTPLTSVIGYLSLLDEALDMPLEQRAKYTHITLEKAYRLERLLNEFFEITRYNLQQISLDKETIDLYYMLVQMVDEFYPILTPHGNTVVLHGDENVMIFGDPIKLARVFNNILKNAIAYSYPNTQIDLRVVTRENEVLILFQNHGKTIPKEKLESIFEKFFRLDEARTTNTGGAGLGLAIAKEIVTLHGGAIEAFSDNQLTTFQVTLPLS